MAQARKVRRKPAASKSRSIPGWAWMLAGLLIGLGVAAVLYLQGADRSGDLATLFGDPESANPEPPAEPAPETEPADPAADEPRFRYYELLPEDEVRVPESERGTPRDTTVVPPASPGDGEPVVLQTGSFRRFGQADAMKARLALLGLDPQVHEADIDGETWYRVYLGPFHDEARVRQTLERLRSENIEALRLHQPG
ncbi:MAG: SPOR domain-containing protein [Pseudomonadota bacterium]